METKGKKPYPHHIYITEEAFETLEDLQRLMRRASGKKPTYGQVLDSLLASLQNDKVKMLCEFIALNPDRMVYVNAVLSSVLHQLENPDKVKPHESGESVARAGDAARRKRKSA